jgi:hypothetical protein
MPPAAHAPGVRIIHDASMVLSVDSCTGAKKISRARFGRGCFSFRHSLLNP